MHTHVTRSRADWLARREHGRRHGGRTSCVNRRQTHMGGLCVVLVCGVKQADEDVASTTLPSLASTAPGNQCCVHCVVAHPEQRCPSSARSRRKLGAARELADSTQLRNAVA